MKGVHESQPFGEKLAGPSWDELYAFAGAQQGLFSVDQAIEAGFSAQLLSKHVGSGNLVRVQRGIYRVTRFPGAERDQEDLIVAWLWSGREGLFSHETALVLHGLSDALPATIHLTVPVSWSKRRLQVPMGVRLYCAEVGLNERGWVGAVPVTTPVRAIVDVARAHGDVGVVDAACRQALQRGLATLESLAEPVAYLADSVGPPGPSRVRHEAVQGLGGRWIQQDLYGVCSVPPAPDWRVEAEAFAASVGASLYATRYYAGSSTMRLSLVWSEDARPVVPDAKDVREGAARRFRWVA